MRYFVEKNSNLSELIRNQFPQFVRNENPLFIDFLISYYESQETKYQPLDLATNLIDYYNISYYNVNALISKTKLSGSIDDSQDVINVESTLGFPEKNGYIQIDKEIIFYRSKTDTQFVDCVRGTSALVLIQKPVAEIVLTSSSSSDHESEVEVINLAYNYASEFLARIKSEIAIDLPETVSDLNYIQFLKNIKSFYAAKGSLNSHKILFKLLFNDKKIKLTLKPGGFGAKIKIDNYNGSVVYRDPTNPSIIFSQPTIVDSGQNYSSDNLPLVDVYGSGYGKPDPSGNILYDTAKIEVTALNVSGGVSDISVINDGLNYVGPITAVVRERNFKEDQIVQNISESGFARVEYWDRDTNELYLYDIVGTFKSSDIIEGIGYEEPHREIQNTSISIDTINGREVLRSFRDGVEILPEEQTIEFFSDYILKPSDSTTIRKRLIRLYKISESELDSFENIRLIQKEDSVFGVQSVNIECDNIVKLSDNIYEADISSNYDFSKVFAPPSTVTTSTKTITTPSFTLEVDDCSRFPRKAGIIYVNGKIILYSERTINQFLNCSFLLNTGDDVIPENSEVFCYGRDNDDLPNFTYFLQDSTETHQFFVLALPGEVVIENGGALYDERVYNYVTSESSNQRFYRTFDEDTSSKVSEYFAYNINRNRTVYNGNGAITGVQMHHEFGNHIYISSSAVPPWIASTPETQDAVDQKLLTRVSKSAFLDQQPISKLNIPTSKSIGVCLDGIQFNSYKGNTIEYGFIDKIIIADGGIYEVPIGTTEFDFLNFPVIDITGTSESNQLKNTSGVSGTRIGLSAFFVSVDFTELVLDGFQPDGYTSRPYIQVINNNSTLTENLTQSNVSNTNEITINNFAGALTGTAVIITTSTLPSPFLVGSRFYIRNTTGNRFTLHLTESDAVLNLNTVSFSGVSSIATYSFTLQTEILNPDNFIDAEFDVSYNELTGSIDNFIIRNSGNGYMNLPDLILKGGGKPDYVIPYKTSSGRHIIRMAGSMISYENYFKENSYEIPYSGTSEIYTTSPIAISLGGGGATATPVISNGRIVSVSLLNPGDGYITPPLVNIFGSGKNAVIEAEISGGQVRGFNIINEGIDYGQDTRIEIETFGRSAVLSAKLKEWTFNLVSRLNSSIDSYGGYVYNETDSDASSSDAIVQITYSEVFPKSISDRQYFILHPAKTTNLINRYYSQQRSGAGKHSPLIGISYDGIPIYGSTGYDDSGNVITMTSGYTLNSTRIGGPSTSTYPLGSFAEDYTFAGTGTLDEHNGRFAVTPEFPNGKYCYFVTNTFPYLIGDRYASTPDTYPNRVCRRNDQIPAVFVRSNELKTSKFDANLFYPKENKNITRSTLYTETLTRGSVDGVIIENRGDKYRFGDRLIVDDSETNGSGFAGFVSKLIGSEIISVNLIFNQLHVTTVDNHNLQISDLVYFDYVQTEQPHLTYLHSNTAGEPVSDNVLNVENISANSNLSFEDTIFYTVSLNSKRNNVIHIPNLPYSFYLDLDKKNRFIIPKQNDSQTIVLNIGDIPERVYLFIQSSGIERVYEISVSPQLAEYSSGFPVTEIISNSEFSIVLPESDYYDINNLKYYTKSKTVSGPIQEVTISNKGYNYKKLPYVSEISSLEGVGASIQCDSSSIGKISSLGYLNTGDGIVSNINVNHQIDIPFSAKILNNYELYEIQVLNGGSGYSENTRIRLDGEVGTGSYLIERSLSGTIQRITVIKSQKDLSGMPVLTLQDLSGSGGVISGKIRRVAISSGPTLMKIPDDINSIINVISYDTNNSVLVYDSKNVDISEQDVLYTLDGIPYGKISNIKIPYIYSKVSSSVEIIPSIVNQNSPSNSLKKITDSNVYQNYSYIIGSSRNTVDWIDKVKLITHPAGHNVFGRTKIERRKTFFKEESRLGSRFTFNVNLYDELELKLKEAPCRFQVLEIPDASPFNVGDYVLGLYSYAIGLLVEKDGNKLTFEMITDQRFEVGDILVNLGTTISIVNENTDRHLLFLTGIMQEPEYTYEFIPIDGINDDITDIDTLIPEFTADPSDVVYDIKTTTPYILLDSFELLATESRYTLTKNGEIYNPNSSDELIISVGGAIQNPNSYNIVSNRFELGEQIGYDNTRVFAIHHPSLRKLTFSGPESATQYVINHTPSSPCNLLIFNCSVFQSSLAGDYTVSGNIINFSETVDRDSLFGWYFDEPVACRIVTNISSDSRIVSSVEECSTTLFRKIALLSSGINSTTETIPLVSASGLPSNPPTITINSSGGSGAVLVPHMLNGQLSRITIQNPGSGYDPGTTLTITGGGGFGAIAIPTIGGSGEFVSILVSDGGEDYDSFKVIILDETNSEVDAEIIEYTSISGNTLIGCTRGAGAESYSSGSKVYFDNF